MRVICLLLLFYFITFYLHLCGTFNGNGGICCSHTNMIYVFCSVLPCHLWPYHLITFVCYFLMSCQNRAPNEILRQSVNHRKRASNNVNFDEKMAPVVSPISYYFYLRGYRMEFSWPSRGNWGRNNVRHNFVN